MKKTLSLVLLSVLLLATTAFAVDSGYRFDASELGFQIAIPEEWMDAVNESTLSFFARNDDAVAQNGINGYALMLMTPDLGGYSGFADYDEAEAWLRDNATVLGGIISYNKTNAQQASLDSLFSGFAKRTVLQEGDTGFVVFMRDAAQTFADPAQNDIAKSVWQAFDQPESIVELFDASADFGVLGSFHTETLAGEHYDNDNIAANELTVVNFWGTYCGPCIEEMPGLGAVAKRYADKGVGFLGVVIDLSDEETAELARSIVAETGADFAHIPPDVSARILNSIEYVPSTILLDRNGQMIGDMHVGSITEAELIDWIEGAMA